MTCAIAVLMNVRDIVAEPINLNDPYNLKEVLNKSSPMQAIMFNIILNPPCSELTI